MDYDKQLENLTVEQQNMIDKLLRTIEKYESIVRFEIHICKDRDLLGSRNRIDFTYYTPSGGNRVFASAKFDGIKWEAYFGNPFTFNELKMSSMRLTPENFSDAIQRMNKVFRKPDQEPYVLYKNIEIEAVLVFILKALTRTEDIKFDIN